LLYKSFKFHHWYFEMKSRTGIYALNYDEMKKVLEEDVIPPPTKMDFSKVQIKVEGIDTYTEREVSKKYVVLYSLSEVSVRIINKSSHSVFYHGSGGNVYYKIDSVENGKWVRESGPMHCGTGEFIGEVKPGGVTNKDTVKFPLPASKYIRIGLSLHTREKSHSAIVWSDPVELTIKKPKKTQSKGKK